MNLRSRVLDFGGGCSCAAVLGDSMPPCFMRRWCIVTTHMYRRLSYRSRMIMLVFFRAVSAALVFFWLACRHDLARDHESSQGGLGDERTLCGLRAWSFLIHWVDRLPKCLIRFL